MYLVNTKYELRRYPDLSGKLGYLEVGDKVDGWKWDDKVFRVTFVNGASLEGYFPNNYLTAEPTVPTQNKIVRAHLIVEMEDGTFIEEELIPE